MRSRKHLTVAALLLMAVSGAAIADVDTIFDATGKFENGAFLGGSVIIDTTTGVLTSADLTVTGPDAGTFTKVDYTGYSSTDAVYLTFVGETSSTTVDALRLGLLTTNLVGYTGGEFDSLDHLSATNYTSDLANGSGTQIDLTEGSLTRVGVVKAPEINTSSAGSALALLAGGLVLLRRKFIV